MRLSRRGFLSFIAAAPVLAATQSQQLLDSSRDSFVDVPDELNLTGLPGGPFLTFARKLPGPCIVYGLTCTGANDGPEIYRVTLRRRRSSGLPLLDFSFHRRANYMWKAYADVMFRQDDALIIDADDSAIIGTLYYRDKNSLFEVK